ncbi:MAG: hypothetical protein AAFQ53_18320 [Bacteroidota bacterium]
MSFTYRIDATRHMVFLRYTDVVDGAEHTRGVDAVLADPAWTLGFDWLIDMQSITALILAREDLDAMRAHRRALHDPSSASRTALVMRPQDEGIAVLYATLVKRDLPPGVKRDVQVFLVFEDALAWLDLDSAPEMR